jgi:hypothetical protein
MKIQVIVATAVAAFSIAAAQSNEPLKTKALSFNINGLTLSGLNGGLGGKVWLANNRALVGSVDGAFSRNFSGAIDSTEQDLKDRYWSAAVNVGMEWHFEWVPGLSPYLVGGALLGNDGSHRTYGSSSVVYTSKSFWTNVGARGGFGLEYWLSRRISVAGQQLVQAQYRFGNNEDRSTSGPTINRDVSQFNLDLGTSSIILSVYL